MTLNSLHSGEIAQCDVLIIGGGPAGSTAATLLARKNYRVTLVEKAHHPRCHSGASLLPANLPLPEKLGAAPAGRAKGRGEGARRCRGQRPDGPAGGYGASRRSGSG